MTTSILRRTAVLGLSLLAAGASTAQTAATWPTRTVRLISPYPTGGGHDAISGDTT